MENENGNDKIQKIRPKSECVYVHMPNGDIINIHSFLDNMYITVWSVKDTLKNVETTVVTKDKISIAFKNQTTEGKKHIYFTTI